VLGEHGTLADLSVEGALARCLHDVLARPAEPRAMRRRWDSVRRRFDWGVLAPNYRRIFAHAAHAPLQDLRLRMATDRSAGQAGIMQRIG
jgi:hypothetical protein